MSILKIAIVSAAMAAAVPANAVVLIDGTPTGPRNGSYVNQADTQNFLVRFTLGAATKVNGLDIFTNSPFGTTGQAVRVRIRADAGGSPSANNLHSFDSKITSSTFFSDADSIAGTDFGAINLAAGTYWFGVSGLADGLAWSSFDNGGPTENPNQWQLAGENLDVMTSVGDFAYRIRGDADVGAVPEPATWLMLLFGFGVIGASMRYRRGTTTVKFA